MFTILAISDSDKHFISAISEYTKRLWKKLIIQDIKPTKHWNQTQIIFKDTSTIKSLLIQKYSNHQKVLLSKEWKSLNTIWFQKLCQSKDHTVFVIGGPYGLDEEELNKIIDTKINFGNMTFPHGLAKLVLSEQIYRVTTILSGKKYHY